MVRCLLSTGAVFLVVALVISALSAKEKHEPYSTFFLDFDLKKTANAYEERATWRLRNSFARSPTKTGMAHGFAFRGELNREDAKKLTQEMASDLYNQVKGAGATRAAKPQETTDERLLGLIKKWWRFAGGNEGDWLQLEGLHGYHFTYTQGKMSGEVDVIAGHASPKNPKEWLIICVIHEPRK